jgi:hypothetical protein
VAARLDLFLPLAHSLYLRRTGLQFQSGMLGLLSELCQQVLTQEDVGGVRFYCLVSNLPSTAVCACANVLNSFTNLVGTLLEGRLYDIQRFKTPHNAHGDKYAAESTMVAPHTTQPTV